MKIIDLINELDGAGLVITDNDAIIAELVSLGINPEWDIDFHNDGIEGMEDDTDG